ncbi:MAG: CHASE domain-containing protein, partial [Cephaloticoccus sp.]
MSPQAQRVLLRRRSLVAAVAALGICLSLASFDVTRQDRDRHLQNDFARRAENHSALVREIILNFESALFGLRNLFIGSHQVTAAEFATAAHEILQRYHGITALEWVPIVPHADRAALEARISAANGQPFQFVTGEGRRSPDAAEYFRILYVEPMAGNERAYGYDLRHGPTTAGLERSRQSSDLTVSHRIRLIQEQDPNQYSVILIWPVRKGPPGGEGTTGYVQAVIRIADMLACPLRDRSVEPLDILYLDRHAPDPA